MKKMRLKNIYTICGLVPYDLDYLYDEALYKLKQDNQGRWYIEE